MSVEIDLKTRCSCIVGVGCRRARVIMVWCVPENQEPGLYAYITLPEICPSCKSYIDNKLTLEVMLCVTLVHLCLSLKKYTQDTFLYIICVLPNIYVVF